MKIIVKNSNVVFASKVIPEEHVFNLSYDDIVNYEYQGDVNLLYQGDIHTGDKVSIQFDQSNTGESIDIYTKSKTSGNYGDNLGMSSMRWIGTGLNVGTVEATAECANIKIYIMDKDATVIKTAGKVSGKVIIERA